MAFKKSMLALMVGGAITGLTACGGGGSSSSDNTDTGSSASGNATLKIDAGTLIAGAPQEALIVTRGSTIDAQGTADAPIVFTSWNQFTAGADTTRGEWAGLALMGNAKDGHCQSAPCNIPAEGNIGYYGGMDDTDSSGTLKYVVVRQAGYDLDGNGNELNGFTLFGTGSGTSISHLQVHKGLDDGIEHFGSADFMDHIVLTDNGDDSFDWGHGYTGGAQFVVIKQASDKADRAIEADNDKTNPETTPVSKPTLANFTMIGDPNGDTGADGILMRRGTGAMFYNSIITGFADACIDFDDAATKAEADAGNLAMTNSVVHCAAPGENYESGDSDIAGADIQSWFQADASNRDNVDPALNADGTPSASSPMLQGTNYAVTGSDLGAGFVDVDYIGAFDPSATSNWTEGWTVGLNGNDTVWTLPAGVTADKTCPAGTTYESQYDVDGDGAVDIDVCRLDRRYSGDTTVHLTNDNIYRLAGGFPGTYIGTGDAEQ